MSQSALEHLNTVITDDDLKKRSAFIAFMSNPAEVRRLSARSLGKDDYFMQLLDEQVGPEHVLDCLFAGQMPLEIAFDLGVPYRVFKRWMDMRCDPADLGAAQNACAEACVLKAQMVLSMPALDATDAAQQRAYSKLLQWMAERLHSDKWGPPKTSDGSAPPAFVVNVINPHSKSETTTIDHETQNVIPADGQLAINVQG